MKKETPLIQLIKKNGVHYSTIVGNSMFPLLRHQKDQIIVKLVDGPCHPFEIVLFQRPSGKIILHRIIVITSNYYFICGDNQYHFEKVPKEWVVGRLTGFFRGSHYYTVSRWQFKIYSFSWWLIFPIRFLFLFAHHKLSFRKDGNK